MKAYGYIHKIEKDKSYIYFPAQGSYAEMNYTNCALRDLFEFDKTKDGFENPLKVANTQQDFGKIVDVAETTLKIKLQNSINYTLPIHFFTKNLDKTSVGSPVKILKNSQGMIIYAEINEVIQVVQEEESYPETFSKKLPFQTMKELFKFNEKIQKSIQSVQHIYSSYRQIRGDGNCYYRAVAFAYIESLCRSSSPSSSFVDFIHTCTEELKPLAQHLFEVKQRLGSATESCELIFMQPENDKILIRDIKTRVMNHLKNDPDKFKPFLTRPLEEEIELILEMGREAEGVPCSFMTEILGINIQNVFLDREGVAENKISNEKSSRCIYLCLRTGHYDLLYPYEQDCEDLSKSKSASPLADFSEFLMEHIQFLYEKLYTLGLNYNIVLGDYFPQTVKKISAFWKDFSALSVQCPEVLSRSQRLLSYVSDTQLMSEVLGLCTFCLSQKSEVKLFCGHFLCKHDALTHLSNSTNALFLINESEGLPPACPVCAAVMTKNDLQKILGKDYEKHEENRLARTKQQQEESDKKKGLRLCKQCQIKKKTSDFNSLHLCICSNCIIPSIQNNLCRHCGKKFSKDYLKSLKIICSICEGPVSNSVIVHPSHSICRNCEKKSFDLGKCEECNLALTEKELKILAEKYCQSCFMCGEYFNSKVLAVRKCGCLICEGCLNKCLSQNSGLCFICSQRLGMAKTQCIICIDSYSRDEMLTLNCDHFFCSACLQKHITNSINEGSEKISCPSCNEIIDGLIIHSLVTEQLWDIYNKASIRKNFRLVDCPKCQNYFETQQNNAECISCGFKFCVGCKEPAHKGACDDQKIRKIIKEIEDRGERVAQCPGCKIPYTKDEGCEHVACTNPQCGSEFCFTCSCHRSPTLIHGNHYHREDCSFYAKFEGPDQYSPKCEVCKKLGKLCQRPKKLKKPRRFQQGED